MEKLDKDAKALAEALRAGDQETLEEIRKRIKDLDLSRDDRSRFRKLVDEYYAKPPP